MNQTKSVEVGQAVITAYFQEGEPSSLVIQSKKHKKLVVTIPCDEIHEFSSWLHGDVLGLTNNAENTAVLDAKPAEIRAVGKQDPTDPLSMRRTLKGTDAPSRISGVAVHDLTTPEGQKKFMGQ